MQYEKGSMLSVLFETPVSDRVQYVLSILENKKLVEFLLYKMQRREQAAERVGWRSLKHQISLDPSDTAGILISLLQGVIGATLVINEDYLQEETDGGSLYGVAHRFLFLYDFIIQRAWQPIYNLVSHNPCLRELGDGELLLCLRKEVDMEVSTGEEKALANPCTAENPCDECLWLAGLKEEIERKYGI